MKKKTWFLWIILCLLTVSLIACQQTHTPTDHFSEPTKEVNTPSVNTEPTEATEDSVSTEAPNIEQPPVGGTEFCPVHYYTYHQMSGALIDDLGEDFDLWIESYAIDDPETECLNDGGTIKAFIDYFQIPRAEFERVCNERWSCVHNIDLLYSDDMAAIEAYYRDIDSREETSKKQDIFGKAKNIIINTYLDVLSIWNSGNQEEIDKTLEEKNSIFELVAEYDVSRAELETALREAKKNRGYDVEYEYDFDVLYNQDGTLKSYDNTKTVVELDALFCGVDNFFTD